MVLMPFSCQRKTISTKLKWHVDEYGPFLSVLALQTALYMSILKKGTESYPQMMLFHAKIVNKSEHPYNMISDSKLLKPSAILYNLITILEPRTTSPYQILTYCMIF